MSTHVPAHASAAPTAQAPARTAVGTAPASSTPRPAGPRFQGRQTFLRSVHSEWIKLWTLWSTWISSIITIALSVLFGAGVVVSYGQVEHLQSTAKNYITYGLSFGQIVVAVLGALVITGEYSSGQIRSSLTAVPNRSRLLLSKAVVLSVVAFILGSLSTFLSWAVSKPFIGEHAGSLADTHYLGHIWGSGLTLTGIALMALGFGFLLRSTAGHSLGCSPLRHHHSACAHVAETDLGRQDSRLPTQYRLRGRQRPVPPGQGVGLHHGSNVLPHSRPGHRGLRRLGDRPAPHRLVRLLPARRLSPAGLRRQPEVMPHVSLHSLPPGLRPLLTSRRHRHPVWLLRR